jgi:hypothetical protein
VSLELSHEDYNVQITNLTRVVFWMTGTLLSFSAMAVSIRILAGKLNIFEILSIRSGVGLPRRSAVPPARKKKGMRVKKRKKPAPKPVPPVQPLGPMGA